MTDRTFWRIDPPQNQYEQAEFEAVARILRRLNPAVSGMSIPALVAHMVNMAQFHLSDGPGYVGTYGYLVTAYHQKGDPDHVLRLKPSLAAHVVENGVITREGDIIGTEG